MVISANNEQGEVFICGKRRQGLVSDEDISGLRIGLVYFLIISMQFVEWNGLIIFSSRYS
jgi:hypothetical protein